MASRRSLVTGGTGFIGSHLVEALLHQGREVRCLVRSPNSLKWIRGLPVEILEGDCTDFVSLRTAVEGMDEIYQVAGVTKAPEHRAFYRTNVLGTENLAKACLERNPNIQRLVYLSSQAAVGPCRGRGLSVETDACQPVSHYGLSKRQGEEAVLRYRDRLSVVILRACAVYGPRDRDFLPIFRSIERGIEIGLWGVQHRVSLCYVDDLVSALVMAADRDLPSGEIFFVSDGNTYTWSDVGAMIARTMGARTIRLGLPVGVFRWCAEVSDWVSRRSGKPQILSKERYQEMIHPNWCCDSSKVVAKLGFSPSFDLERGVGETVRWYRTQGWLKS